MGIKIDFEPAPIGVERMIEHNTISLDAASGVTSPTSSPEMESRASLRRQREVSFEGTSLEGLQLLPASPSSPASPATSRDMSRGTSGDSVSAGAIGLGLAGFSFPPAGSTFNVPSMRTSNALGASPFSTQPPWSAVSPAASPTPSASRAAKVTASTTAPPIVYPGGWRSAKKEKDRLLERERLRESEREKERQQERAATSTPATTRETIAAQDSSAGSSSKAAGGGKHSKRKDSAGVTRGEGSGGGGQQKVSKEQDALAAPAERVIPGLPKKPAGTSSRKSKKK